MEQVAKISGVRYIKASEKVKEPFVIIDLANGKPSIIRTVNQFLIDAEESALTLGREPHLATQAMVNLRIDLLGGLVRGNFIHTKAGDKYTVTKDSRVITDPTHPMFSKVTIGQELTSEKDRTIVQDGFLMLTRNPQAEFMVRRSQAWASEQVKFEQMFEIPTSNAVPAETVVKEEVDPEVINAVLKEENNKETKK